jgi:hypothetical protein
MKRLLPLATLTTVLMGIGGCNFIIPVAKESALSVTGRAGWDSFNLTGELPAEFGVEATVWYGPISPSASCETDNFYTGKKMPRSYVKSFEQDFHPQAQTFKFKVPLKYSVGLCAMEIGRVDMKIRGRYGVKDWQKSYDDAGLRFVKALPEGSPDFDASGRLEIIGKCEWLFQDSKLVMGLSKLLNCKGAGAYLQVERLSEKTVNFNILVNPEERPYYDETWVKFPDGWKPCAEVRKNWIWCEIPPTFKTFRMNHKICTIYPGCME